MSDTEFKDGRSYIGTATHDNKIQRIFTVVGRREGVISFANVQDVRREIVEDVCGVETAKLREADGIFFISARVEADIDRAFNIVRLCKGLKANV